MGRAKQSAGTLQAYLCAKQPCLHHGSGASAHNFLILRAANTIHFFENVLAAGVPLKADPADPTLCGTICEKQEINRTIYYLFLTRRAENIEFSFILFILRAFTVATLEYHK